MGHTSSHRTGRWALLTAAVTIVLATVSCAAGHSAAGDTFPPSAAPKMQGIPTSCGLPWMTDGCKEWHRYAEVFSATSSFVRAAEPVRALVMAGGGGSGLADMASRAASKNTECGKKVRWAFMWTLNDVRGAGKLADFTKVVFTRGGPWGSMYWPTAQVLTAFAVAAGQKARLHGDIVNVLATFAGTACMP